MRLGLIFLLLSQAASAALLHTKQNSGFTCERILAGDYEIVASANMTTSMMEEIKEAAEEIFGKGGVLARLGISSPKQRIQFMPGSDLNTISSLNRYPIGQWHDGAMIAKTDRSGIIYEIVIPGRTVRHSLFREDNTFAAQVSILLHVAGHNHFAVHTRFRQVRTADLVQESYDLDAFMERLKMHGTHPDEISRWYQYLLSLTWSQDVINGTTFDDLDELRARVEPGGRLGVRRTANILQTYIANLPPELPEWKREMARRFERLQRYISGAIRTKIMNEGFATLLQEITVKHSSFKSFNYGIQYCCLMSGVTRPDIGNPYWLGLEAWRLIYKRFNEGFFTRTWLDRNGFSNHGAQPDVGLLDSEAKDRAFIEWATQNVIQIVDDQGLLELAFRDGVWIGQQNLAIMRPVKQEEWDRGMGQPPNQQNNWQWVIDSRNAERVLKTLVTNVKGFEYQFPNIEITDLVHQDSGMIRLEISDEIGRRVALDRRTLVQTLFVHAKFNDRPVSLESTFDIKGERILGVYDYDNPSPITFPPDVRRQDIQSRHEDNKIVYYVDGFAQKRVEVRVFPNGTVEAYRVLRDESDAIDSLPESRIFTEDKKTEYKRFDEVEPQLQKLLKSFVDNLAIDDPDGEGVDFRDQPFRKSVLDRLEDQLTQAAANSGPSLTMQLAVPTAGKALDAYESYVKRRMHKALHLALNGKSGLVTRGNSVAIKALPDIPQFSFDRKSLKRLQDFTPPRQLRMPNTQLLSFTERLDADDFGRVVPVPGREGDRRWGPDPNKEDGSGEGEGEDGEGEPGEEPSEGTNPGEGSGGVSWVDISLDAYAKALEDVVELPNLKPKGDKSLTRTEEKGGKVYRRDGTLVPKEIIRKAYRRGMTEIIQNNEDADDMLPPEIIRRGLAKLKDSDYVVRGTQPRKTPEVNAQVTLILDLSGSMGPMVEQAKRAFFDLRAILMRKYKSITFRFVSFDSKAEVFDDFDKFLRAQMNGGTSYVEGLKKDLEIKQQFPEARFDRFTVLIGDMEDFGGPEFEKALEQVIEQSQFVAALRFNDRAPSGGGFDLMPLLQSLHGREDYFGFVNVSPAKSYTPYAFRQAFKNLEK